MVTKKKMWLGIGAFALIQAAGISLSAPAQAGDGSCGWERAQNTGRWMYDANCENGERDRGNRGGYYNGNRGYNERGYGWGNNGRYDNRYHGKRPDSRWEQGERGERWGERG